MNPFFAEQFASEHIARLHAEARSNGLAKVAKPVAGAPEPPHRGLVPFSLGRQIIAAVRRAGLSAVSFLHR
jgi:hypothetical protein